MTNEFFPLGDCFHFLWIYSCPRRLFGPLRFEKLQVYTVNLSCSSPSSLSARLLFYLSLTDSERSSNSSKRRLETSVVRKRVAASEISSKRSNVIVALLCFVFTQVSTEQNGSFEGFKCTAEPRFVFVFCKWHNACLYSEMPHYETVHVHT